MRAEGSADSCRVSRSCSLLAGGLTGFEGSFEAFEGLEKTSQPLETLGASKASKVPSSSPSKAAPRTKSLPCLDVGVLHNRTIPHDCCFLLFSARLAAPASLKSAQDVVNRLVFHRFVANFEGVGSRVGLRGLGFRGLGFRV